MSIYSEVGERTKELSLTKHKMEQNDLLTNLGLTAQLMLAVQLISIQMECWCEGSQLDTLQYTSAKICPD